MNKKIIALASLLSFGFVVAAHAGEPAAPAPAPQDKKTDAPPAKKDDPKAPAPADGKKK